MGSEKKRKYLYTRAETSLSYRYDVIKVTCRSSTRRGRVLTVSISE